MKLFRITLWVQSLYYFLTGIWPLADIGSFMKVTGPKTDIWLVKTVAVLLMSISFSFVAGLLVRSHWLPLAILAICCCISLAAIDFYYVHKNIISAIYLSDGIIHTLLLLTWIIVLAQVKKVA
ncbi:MAG TPA: hypothetical protein VLI68_16075 [Hanamia sp.]|jgi:hypothetical protein|nr:hypothetical protein [Hanamia sp.]